MEPSSGGSTNCSEQYDRPGRRHYPYPQCSSERPWSNDGGSPLLRFLLAPSYLRLISRGTAAARPARAPHPGPPTGLQSIRLMDCFGDSSSDEGEEECPGSERDSSCGVFSFHPNTEVCSLPIGVTKCHLSQNLPLLAMASASARRRCLCM